MRETELFLERALLEAGRLTPKDAERCRRISREEGISFAEAAAASDAVNPREIALIRAELCEIPFVDPDNFDVCYENSRLLPRSLAERFTVFPLFDLDGVLTLGMEDPLDLEAVDQVRELVKREVEPVVCEPERLRALIGRAYSLGTARAEGEGERDEVDVEVEGDPGEERRPVVAAVNQILRDAVEQNASDVHVNPDEHELHLRYRIDGVLRERQAPPRSMHASIVQRIKVIARLDLTQTRKPQDGKFRFRHGGREIDVRVSTIPTVCGENVVMRLLAGCRSVGDFRELGMSREVAAGLEDLLARPHGLLLVSGPTGSGKTTTLYGALSRINDPSKNIVTIEDPVEMRLPYLRQVQVNPEVGLTFASALRSVLRQDPDVVLVGEIRDAETAPIALQAALTGHLVLSTVHTNDAAGAVARLRDFGAAPFVINAATLGVLAQRLARRVCPECERPAPPSEEERRRCGLGATVDGFRRGAGCAACGRTGYRGRTGLYELLRFDSRIRDLVERGEGTDAIRRAALKAGMRTMWEDGIDKASRGVTTLAEVLKVAAPADADADAGVTGLARARKEAA